MKSWKYSGLQVFYGPRIHPGEKEAMKNLARYFIRASVSQERIASFQEQSRIIY